MPSATSQKIVMSGNEAIARGAIEAGIKFCASYPGTPSTEIAATLLSNADKWDMYVEWSANEKVALESAAAASWVGIPAICPMKSLGLNVAADFLLNLNLSGSGPGGLVLVVCDDPKGHSSSNEQDSRFYAKAAQIPLVEPASCQQAKELIGAALNLSKRHRIPVMIRSTTRLSHSRALVKCKSVKKTPWRISQSLPKGLYNVPKPYLKHRDLLDKMKEIALEFEDVGWNDPAPKDDVDVLVISTGICKKYAKEAVNILDNQSVQTLGLVTTYPLPAKLIADSLQKASKIIFAEETDPFIEDEIKILAADIHQEKSTEFLGKRSGLIPPFGEMNTDIMLHAIAHTLGKSYDALPKETQKEIAKAKDLLIPRPLTFCAGCTHRNVYWAIQKVKNRLGGKLIVTGDIGCYSLGVFYGDSMNTMQAMGSGIGAACGLGQLEKYGLESKVIAVAGDSTFFHACIPALVNASHKNANLTFIILDNATTAMTGYQIHPGSKQQALGLDRISITSIVQSISPDILEKGDSANIASTIELVFQTVKEKGVKVLLLEGVCRLEEVRRGIDYSSQAVVQIDNDLCHGSACRICVGGFACPAIAWNSSSDRPSILDHVCVRCGACIDVCPHRAIQQEEDR